jgi:hypothetical protein
MIWPPSRQRRPRSAGYKATPRRRTRPSRGSSRPPCASQAQSVLIADLRRGPGAWPTRPCGSVTSYSRLGRCYRFSAAPNETYIIANFKETQIAYLRVGQSVSVQVDALPGEKLRGDIQLPRRDGFELRSAAECDGQFHKDRPADCGENHPRRSRGVGPRGLTGHVGIGNGDAHCGAWLAGGRFSKVN